MICNYFKTLWRDVLVMCFFLHAKCAVTLDVTSRVNVAAHETAQKNVIFHATLYFFTFWPFPAVTDHFVRNGHTRFREKFVETAHPVTCVQFLAVNSTCICSSLEIWIKHRLSRISGVLWLIFNRVKTCMFGICHTLSRDK